MRTPPINPKIIATLPVLLSAGIVTTVVYFQNWTHYLSPLTLGILAGGLADLDNGFTGRLKNILFSMIAFGISSVSVQLTFSQPLLQVLTFTAIAFIFTMFGAAGNRYRTIAFATVAVAVYTALAHAENDKWYLITGLMLCGALLHSLCSLLVHIVFPHRPVQENMANAYTALSHYLSVKADFFDPDETEFLEKQQIDLAMKNSQVSTAFLACQNALFYRMKGQHRHPRTTKMLRYYFTAQEIHERISSSHVHYQAFAEQMKYTDLIFRIQRLLRLQSQACLEFAASLRSNNNDYRYSPRLARATANAEKSLQHYASQSSTKHDIAPYRVQRLLDNIMHVSLQFSHLGRSSELPEEINEKSRLISPEIGGFKGAWQALKKQNTVQSPVFRHAVRMAISVCLCCLIVQNMPQLHADFGVIKEQSVNLGYWVLLTAVFVCQPNYSATKKRLIQRILGTVAGVLVGSFLPILMLDLSIKLAIVVVMLSLFFLFRTNKHSFSTFFITIQAIIGFSIAGYDVTEFFVPRVMDTVIGAFVSGMLVYFLWPDWKYSSIEKTGAQAITSNAGYLRAVLNELQIHHQEDHTNYRQVRRVSQDRAASLASSISDMSSEPKKYGHQLKDGFRLLKINYSLISYIAALGAFRHRMQRDEDDHVFLLPFFTLGAKIVEVLQNMTIWSPEQFQAAMIQIQNDLESLRQQQQLSEHQEQNQVLWQQLMMISDLLRPCYAVLNHQFEESAQGLVAQ